jgi:hypothetical protein
MFGICSKSNGKFPLINIALTFKNRELFLKGKKVRGQIIQIQLNELEEKRSIPAIEPMIIQVTNGTSEVSWILGSKPVAIFRINKQEVGLSGDDHEIQNMKLYQIHLIYMGSASYAKYRKRFSVLKKEAVTLVPAAT